MSPPWTPWCAALVLLFLAACSRDPPTAPRLYSLSGHLHLTGYLVDANGQFAGTRVVGDADGIPVELLHGSEVVGRTTTVDGVYRFSGLAPGGYVARSRVIGDIADETLPMTIVLSDVSSGDTLRLASRGDIYPIPNPFADTTWFYFEVPVAESIDVRILDLEGNTVNSLLALRVIPWRHGVMWDGRDTRGTPVTGAMYWVTFVSGLDVRAHILFREPLPPSPPATSARVAAATARRRGRCRRPRAPSAGASPAPRRRARAWRRRAAPPRVRP